MNKYLTLSVAVMATLNNEVSAVKVQSQLKTAVSTEMQAEAQVETLSEGLVLAEAQAEAKIIAAEETQLQINTKINENEKNKFIEIVSDQDMNILS